MARYVPTRKEVLKHFGFGTENMKRIRICPVCMSAQDEKNVFCGICHALLPKKTVFDFYKELHSCCKNCGNVLPSDAEFCPMCGAKQNEEREAI